MISSFKTVSNDSSILMFTDSPTHDFRRWNYHGVQFGKIPENVDVDQAHEILAKIFRTLPGEPILGAGSYRPRVSEKGEARAILHEPSVSVYSKTSHRQTSKCQIFIVKRALLRIVSDCYVDLLVRCYS